MIRIDQDCLFHFHLKIGWTISWTANHNANQYCTTLYFWLNWQQQIYKKILHNTKYAFREADNKIHEINVKMVLLDITHNVSDHATLYCLKFYHFDGCKMWKSHFQVIQKYITSISRSSFFSYSTTSTNALLGSHLQLPLLLLPDESWPKYFKKNFSKKIQWPLNTQKLQQLFGKIKSKQKRFSKQSKFYS